MVKSRLKKQVDYRYGYLERDKKQALNLSRGGESLKNQFSSLSRRWENLKNQFPDLSRRWENLKNQFPDLSRRGKTPKINLFNFPNFEIAYF